MLKKLSFFIPVLAVAFAILTSSALAASWTVLGGDPLFQGGIKGSGETARENFVHDMTSARGHQAMSLAGLNTAEIKGLDNAFQRGQFNSCSLKVGMTFKAMSYGVGAILVDHNVTYDDTAVPSAPAFCFDVSVKIGNTIYTITGLVPRKCVNFSIIKITKKPCPKPKPAPKKPTSCGCSTTTTPAPTTPAGNCNSSGSGGNSGNTGTTVTGSCNCDNSPNSCNTTIVPPTPTPTCPSGETGTYPNCSTPTCPSGETGTYPNCSTPPCTSNCSPPPPNNVRVSCTGPEEISGGGSVVWSCSVADDDGSSIALSANANNNNATVTGINCYTSNGAQMCPSGGTFQFRITGENNTSQVEQTSVTVIATADKNASATYKSGNIDVDPSDGGF